MSDYAVRRFETLSSVAPALNFALVNSGHIRIIASARAADETADRALAFIVPHEKARVYQVIAGPDLSIATHVRNVLDNARDDYSRNVNPIIYPTSIWRRHESM